MTAEEQEELARQYAEAFVRALLQGTDPVKNKAHEVSPCPVVFWEDSVWCDNEALRPVQK